MQDLKVKEELHSSLSSKQHKNGKLTARERISILLDDNSFFEIDEKVTHRCTNFSMDKKISPGDGVVTGFGTVNKKKVFIVAQDFSFLGGSLSETHAQKICKIIDLAIENRSPIIMLNDSGGARIQEGIDSLGGYGRIFAKNVQASGVIPQISVIMGPCAGGAVYSPALTDFIFMVKNTSYMFLTGPDVVKQVMFEDVSKDDLGGYDLHTKNSGVVDIALDNDIEMLSFLREFIRFIPQCNTSHKIKISDFTNDKPNFSLSNFVPTDTSKGYDIRHIIEQIVDNKIFYELKPYYAKNIIICFAKIANTTVGIIANQPNQLAGCLDINASLKGARFIRYCDTFNIPIVSLVDVPGFLPGTNQESGGIIKHGAKLLYAYAESTVPKISIILRKAYGGSYIVMGSKHLGSDFNYAWPNAEIAVMGAESAVDVLYKKNIKEEPSCRSILIKEYNSTFANPKIAASRGFIDKIINPEDTRSTVIKSLYFLSNKRKKEQIQKKHDNIPI
ncbi:MAG: propionyl-CoA carboxylase, beta subunit [Candidatus Xenolissoclinum pacificiensis L6]|uniref:Propionyl-CoA carboxylase, beta subunit n=1 Tax=Candidatus Xenolissoclinum pacificiensis L6 TaxID=1401685 RepID=W2V2W7_9RICK|nr:MAG: propionyl-CoA carboxylase, beta subunit [Candidatus Xenolissoclinum pacificiensis L6]